MKYYLIGIKGSGMSALAMFLNDLGYKVCGVDIKEHLFTEDELVSLRIDIEEIDDVKLLDYNEDIVIYSSAYKDSDLVKKALKESICYEYHEFIGRICKNHRVIAVSGTHGKTTLVNMLDLVLDHKTSLIEGDGKGRAMSYNDTLLLEACEYQDHFLSYHPDLSIVLKLSLDHTDYFKSMDDYIESFKKFMKNSSHVLLSYENFQYGFQGQVYNHDPHSFSYRQIDVREAEVTYEIYGAKYGPYKMPFSNEYQADLSLCSIIVGLKEGIDVETSIKRLKKFIGPKRRMKITRENGCLFIDDYAHQPYQISKVYGGIKSSGEKILFFKPDRLSRLTDFKDEFMVEFDKFDDVYLIPYHDITREILLELFKDRYEIYGSNIQIDENSTLFFLSSKSMEKEIREIKKALTHL